MNPWNDQDLAALRVLDAGLGGISMLELIEENRMTEQAPEDFTGGDESGWGEATGANAPAFPEHPDNPHEAPLSVNFKPGGTPQLTVRARTVQEHMDLLQQVQSSGLLALIQSVNSAFGGQGAAPAPAPQANPFNQQPAQPFPNQPYPGQPAWQTAGAPPQQQWGGGAPQAPAQSGRKQYPAPQGWFRLNVPYPKGTDQLHALAQQSQVPKGNPDKGGMYNFWGLSPSGQPGKAWYCAPQVAPVFAQFNPMPA